jgi:hypothetical protein
MTIELLDLNELAGLLGRSPETIKKDMLRNPLAVPPRLHIRALVSSGGVRLTLQPSLPAMSKNAMLKAAVTSKCATPNARSD